MRNVKNQTSAIVRAYGVYTTRKNLENQALRRDTGLGLTPAEATKALAVFDRPNAKPVSPRVQARMGLPEKGQFVKVHTGEVYTVRNGTQKQRVLFVQVPTRR